MDLLAALWASGAQNPPGATASCRAPADPLQVVQSSPWAAVRVGNVGLVGCPGLCLSWGATYLVHAHSVLSSEKLSLPPQSPGARAEALSGSLPSDLIIWQCSSCIPHPLPLPLPFWKPQDKAKSRLVLHRGGKRKETVTDHAGTP